LEEGLEGLQEWRLRGEIWRGMQNRAPFGGSVGVIFYTKPSNFGVEAHMEALAGFARNLCLLFPGHNSPVTSDNQKLIKN
jgi:hypothetical protein